MPTKKKMTGRKTKPAARDTKVRTLRKPEARKPEGPKSAAERLRQTWNTTVEAITTAESDLEKQVKAVLHRNKISTKDASAMFKDLSALVGRERKKALHDLETRLGAIQAKSREAAQGGGRAGRRRAPECPGPLQPAHAPGGSGPDPQGRRPLEEDRPLQALAVDRQGPC